MTVDRITAQFGFAGTQKVLKSTSTIVEVVTNQTLHASFHSIPPRIELHDKETWTYAFFSEGGFGSRGKAGLEVITGNCEEGQQGMGANLLWHDRKAVIRTSFSPATTPVEDADHVLLTFVGDGTIEVEALEEQWDGLTEVMMRTSSSAIRSALEEIVSAPQPYLFDGREWGVGGKISPLRWESYGCVDYIYRSPKCPGFVRRIKGRTYGNVSGDFVVDDDHWLPGRMGLTPEGRSAVRNSVKEFERNHVPDPLDFIGADLKAAQERWPGLKYSPPTTVSQVRMRRFLTTVSALFGWGGGKIPHALCDGSDYAAWEVLDEWLSGWHTMARDPSMDPVAALFRRNPRRPAAMPQMIGPMDVVQVLYEEERGTTVGPFGLAPKSGMRYVGIFGGKGSPTGSLYGVERALEKEFAEIQAPPAQKIKGADSMLAVPPPEAAPPEPVEPVGSEQDIAGAVREFVERPKTRYATPEVAATAAAVARIVSETLTTVTPSECEDDEEDEEDIVTVPPIVEGMVQIFPEGCVTKVSVSRVSAGRSAPDRVFPAVHREELPPPALTAHDVRLGVMWTECVRAVRETVPEYQGRLLVALDANEAPEEGTGVPNALAYATGDAVILLTRCERWVGGLSGLVPKKYLARSPMILGQLVYAAVHEVAHVIDGNGGHGDDFFEVFNSLWLRMDVDKTVRHLRRLLKLKDGELFSMLPQAE